MIRAVGLAVILVLTAASGTAAESPVGGGGVNAPLQMEELEVLGRRQTPEVLYLPVHRGIALPAPVRYDLFLEDMEKPVLPREITPQERPADRTFGQ